MYWIFQKNPPQKINKKGSEKSIKKEVKNQHVFISINGTTVYDCTTSTKELDLLIKMNS